MSDDGASPMRASERGAAGGRRSHTGCCRSALLALRAGPALILLILIVVVSLTTPVFLTSRNIGNVFSQTVGDRRARARPAARDRQPRASTSPSARRSRSRVSSARSSTSTSTRRALVDRWRSSAPGSRSGSRTGSSSSSGASRTRSSSRSRRLSIVRGLALWAANGTLIPGMPTGRATRSAAARSAGSRTRSSSSSALALLALLSDDPPGLGPLAVRGRRQPRGARRRRASRSGASSSPSMS